MGALSFKEFKPTIYFLGKFVGLYIVLSLLYGMYITSYHPRPDPITQVVSNHSASVLIGLGTNVITENSMTKPTTTLFCDGKRIVSVYEGCNGINVMIVFISFVIAFGPFSKKMIWFIPAGFILIHLINLGRISMLFWVARNRPDYMYFTHKYFFTAIIYVAVLVLWIWWVRISPATISQKK
jgi:exosortase family protein XrtF